MRPMSNADLGEVVEIHIKAFEGFFLTLLGREFLLNLYANFILDDLSICLVAEKENRIKGFAVGNRKPANLFRNMLIRKGYLFLYHSIKALVKNPILVIRKLLYALRYRGECPDGFASPALLSSIGVDPGEETKGIGSHLMMAFCYEAFSKGSDVVYLTTDAVGNDRVNSFYLRNGFKLYDIIEKTNGRKMNRYIKLPDEENL